MTQFKFIIFSCLAILFSRSSFAQNVIQAPAPGVYDTASNMKRPDSTLKLKVTAIHISGNKKTKNYIILREMPFKEGDSLIISRLLDTLKQARYQVYNINLFSEVEVTPLIISAHELEVHVKVREKWYVYPTPQFQLIDRNFNDWLKTYNADFNRVVYGVKFAHYNFSGRGDQLRIYLLNGYSRNISFSYNAPYSNSKLTEGFRISGGYSQNREISYKTNYYNKLLNFKKTGFVRNNLFASASYQLRKGFFKRHVVSLSYTYINLNDSIIDPLYNPHYFNSSRSSLGITDLSYSFIYSNTDNVNYPLKGSVYGFSVLKRGFGFQGGVNMLSLSGVYNRYFTHKKHWYSTAQFYTKVILPFTQPYINQRSIGYADFYLRGLEYYVIDGVAAAVAKYTLKKKLFSFHINVPFHIKAVPRIPFVFYAKTYADAGYSYIKKEFDTRLNNKFLYTGGFGIDILSLYDANIYLEYSFNQLGENGIFLHAKVGF
ncbi:MAG: POTRA domain-containing protein [Ferruginibacter sp.]